MTSQSRKLRIRTNSGASHNRNVGNMCDQPNDAAKWHKQQAIAKDVFWQFYNVNDLKALRAQHGAEAINTAMTTMTLAAMRAKFNF